MLLVANNGDVQVGTPTIDGAVVEAEIVEHAKDKKLRVFKYKNKTRYRRRIGHRTQYTRLAIKRILQDGKEAVTAEPAEKPKAKRPSRRPKKKPEVKAQETAAEAPAEPAAEAETPVSEAAAPTTETKPKRTTRRTTRRKAPEGEGDTSPKPEASAGEKKPARRRSSGTKSTRSTGTTQRRTRAKPEDKPDSKESGG